VKRLTVIAMLTGGPLVACTGLGAPAMTGTHAAAIRDSVQVTLDAFRRYSAAGRWDSLAALYADDPDFRWMEQGMIQYRSRSQILQALARVPQSTRIETSYLDTKIVALGPGAAAVATTFLTKFVEGGSVRTQYGGVLDMVLVHREGGWRILMGHSSSRQPR
jgi:hypothetical protein